MGIFGHWFGHQGPKPAQPTFSPSAKGPFVFPGLDENLQPIRSEVRKPEPSLPDYASYSDRQLAECFLPKNWSAADCDNNHRQAILQEASNRFADAHHLPHTRVHLDSGMAANDMGAYSPGSRSIELNPTYLDNPFEALDSVTHETQHYVDDMNVHRGSGDTAENRAIYACENSSGGYGAPPSPNAERGAAWNDALDYYELQSLEAHANNAGFAAVASHHDLFKSCPEYSQYLDGRSRYFSNLRDKLAADPEKWKAMEQDHLKKATGQTPETIQTAVEEVKRGTDAQQKAIENASSVQLLQRDCARSQQQQAQPVQAAQQSRPVQAAPAPANIPGAENAPEGQNASPLKAASPDQSAAAAASVRSQHDAFVESLRVRPGQNAGQASGQAAGTAAADGAPPPPERERSLEEEQGRMRRAAPVPDRQESAPGEPAASREVSTGGSSGSEKQPERQTTQQAAPRSPEAAKPAPREQAPDTGEQAASPQEQTNEESADSLNREVPGEEAAEGQAPQEQAAETAAPAQGAAPREVQNEQAPPSVQDGQQDRPGQETTGQQSGEAAPREQAPDTGEQTASPQEQTNEESAHSLNREVPGEGAAEGQAPQEPAAETVAPAQDAAPPAEQSTENISSANTVEDDHSTGESPRQEAEEAEGIREPEPAREQSTGEAQDGIRDLPVSAEEQTVGQEDGIRDTPAPAEAQDAGQADGIRDVSQEKDTTPAQEDGIRDSGEESAPAQEEQAEGISGQDTAPAESAGEEMGMGQ